MPSFLKVELSRHCTIGCKGCKFPKEYKFYPADRYKKLIDKFHEYIFMCQLYEIGEPLWHQDLIECINYAHNKNIATVISTTLSLKKPESYWERLVFSGLDRLIIAIDGITDDVYNSYRTNGNLGLVMSNLEKVLNIKGDLHVEWQMIDFQWNKHEQNVARKIAYDIGCDSFQIIKDTREVREYRKQETCRNRNCIWPFFLCLVNVYDNIIPCFKPGCNPGILGNLQATSFEDIWNGEEIQKIRSKELIRWRSGCRSCIE
jgi:MoaA/NifB/PqqE/SkfB family radical SAM enzyme